MPIRWGIVGCGDVCEVKSGPGFQKAADSELVAVMRRDTAQAKDFAKRHGVTKWYDRADQLIADSNVDAVYVASPPGSHLELARQVAAAGKPCLLEKPMARNVPECRELMQSFQATNTPLFVAYYRRCLPRFVQVRERLAEIGPLQSVRYEFKQLPWTDVDSANLPWRVVPEYSGGGLFLDLGCHALDLIDHLVGPLRLETADAANTGLQYDAEDLVEFTCSTKTDGIPVIGLFDFQAEDKADLLTMTGEQGTITVPCFDNGPITITKSGSPQEILDIPHPDHVHQPLIQTVVDELLGRGKCPSNAASAVRTSELIDGILNDYYGGRDRPFWENPAAD